jgi:hypothetical protein
MAAFELRRSPIQAMAEGRGTLSQGGFCARLLVPGLFDGLMA